MATPVEKVTRFRLAVVTSHPVQYQAPLFQRLACDTRLDLTVYYGHDGSVVGEIDRDFGVPVIWDRPLLEGYRSTFLTHRQNDRPARILTFAVVGGLISEFRRERYDAAVIHSYATASSGVGYLAASLTCTPILLRTESELLQKRTVTRELLRRMFMKVLTRLTSRFLVIGSANRAFYLDLKVPQERMFDTPYAVDNEFFDRSRTALLPRRDEIRSAFGFPAHLPVVVFSAKLIDRKRPLDLVEAIGRLAREGTPVGLLMIGEGSLRKDIEQAVQMHQLQYVRLTGFINQTGLSRCYTAGDVFVLPAQFDTWGLVVNEAMVFGMPVIVSDMVGAGLDLVEPGVTGFVYPVGDIDALTAHLRVLVADVAKRTMMGKAARAKVLSWDFGKDVAGIMAALQSLSPRRSEATE